MNAPATTVANPAWFRAGDVNRPRIERARLHHRLLDDARAAAPEAANDRRAIVVTGPTATDRRSAIEDVLGATVTGYLRIDAGQFATQLLSVFDGDDEPSPDDVAEEARALAERLRDAAVRDGVNIVIDTTFTGPDQAVAVGRQLANAGYTIDVVDIQPVAPTPEPTQSRDAAQRLAADVEAVTAYRRYSTRTGGSLTLEADLARPAGRGPLVDASAARALAAARAGSPGLAPRHGHRGRGD